MARQKRAAREPGPRCLEQDQLGWSQPDRTSVRRDQVSRSLTHSPFPIVFWALTFLRTTRPQGRWRKTSAAQLGKSAGSIFAALADESRHAEVFDSGGKARVTRSTSIGVHGRKEVDSFYLQHKPSRRRPDGSTWELGRQQTLRQQPSIMYSEFSYIHLAADLPRLSHLQPSFSTFFIWRHPSQPPSLTVNNSNDPVLQTRRPRPTLQTHYCSTALFILSSCRFTFVHMLPFSYFSFLTQWILSKVSWDFFYLNRIMNNCITVTIISKVSQAVGAIPFLGRWCQTCLISMTEGMHVCVRVLQLEFFPFFLPTFGPHFSQCNTYTFVNNGGSTTTKLLLWSTSEARGGSERNPQFVMVLAIVKILTNIMMPSCHTVTMRVKAGGRVFQIRNSACSRSYPWPSHGPDKNARDAAGYRRSMLSQ